GDDLPDFIVRHPNTLPIGTVRGHDGAGNSLTNVLEEVGVGISMTLVGGRQIGAAPAAARAQAMTESTVDAEFEFPAFRRLGDSGKWILSFCSEYGIGQPHQQSQLPQRGQCAPPAPE